MKFGDYLKAHLCEEWSDNYLNYDKLKKIIKRLEERHINVENVGGIGTSLSVPLPTNAAGMPISAGQADITQEDFFKFLESEMRKIEEFTRAQVCYNNRRLLMSSACYYLQLFVLRSTRSERRCDL